MYVTVLLSVVEDAPLMPNGHRSWAVLPRLHDLNLNVTKLNSKATLYSVRDVHTSDCGRHFHVCCLLVLRFTAPGSQQKTN